MKRLLLLAALAAAPPALAQNAAPAAPDPQRQAPASTIVAEPVAVMIAAFDADGDARVTGPEFAAGLRRSFDAIDTGGTGSIGYIAFSDWALRYLGDRNALPSPFEVDQDGDKRISYAELAARFDLFFARFDADKDGVLARSELIVLRGFSIGGREGPEGGRPEGGKRRRPNLGPMS